MKEQKRYDAFRRKRRRLLFKRIRFICILLIIIFSGWYIQGSLTQQGALPGIDVSVNGNVPVMNQDGTKEKAIDIAKPKKKTNSIRLNVLEENLKQYIKNYQGQYGIYYYNLENHDELGINHEDVYVAASTIKIPLNLYLYQRVKNGSVDLQGVLTYLKEDYEEGTGKIQYEDFGKKYNIEELSKLSIVSSDNVAANMLFRFLGISKVKELMSQVGGTVVEDDKNTSCPKDMGLYMSMVYDFYINEKVLGSKLMNSFLYTDFNDRIPAQLPKTVKVAHKIGTQVGTVNDIGIVFADTPYIIAVMSKNVDEDEAPSVVSNISKMIYDFVNEKS